MIVRIVLAATVLLVLVAVDVRAEAAFDAPKRFLAIVGITVAAAAALIRGIPRPTDRTRAQRIALGCAAGSLLLVVVSALVSNHAGVALDAVRTIVVFSTVAWLCVAEENWDAVRGGFVAGAVVNALVSLAQWGGVAQPFRYATEGGRANVSALVGNTGVLALVLAFALVLVLPRILEKRPAWIAAAVVLLAAMLVNRSVTAVITLATALVVFGAGRVRYVRIVAAASIVIAGAFLLARGTIGVVSLDRVLTYRLGPWAAACEMTIARPLLGFGPGTFGAEYAPYFLDAQMRWQTSLGHPLLTGSYVNAHNDYLQAFAEIGISAALLAIAAAAIVTTLGARRAEALKDVAVVALLVGGAVAALTWFPLQRPETALLLVAAVGRAWRIAA